MADDSVATHFRDFRNYSDPKTGRRMHPSLERWGDARAARNEIVTTVQRDSFSNPRAAPKMKALTDHWLACGQGRVKAATLMSYGVVCELIKGPLARDLQSYR
jgi:hypothetical protein